MKFWFRHLLIDYHYHMVMHYNKKLKKHINKFNVFYEKNGHEIENHAH